MLLAPALSGLTESRLVERIEPAVSDLVRAAADGSRAAWDDLVRRFTPLVLSIAGRHRLSHADAADVSQTVWLKLVQHLSRLRDPDALPGWIATATRHECLRLLGSRQRATPYDPQSDGRWHDAASDWPEPAADLLRNERHEALLAGFAELPDRQRELLVLLLTDPAPSYAEISQRLGMPVGAIGPTRARALERLRRSPALAALLRSDLVES